MTKEDGDCWRGQPIVCLTIIILVADFFATLPMILMGEGAWRSNSEGWKELLGPIRLKTRYLRTLKLEPGKPPSMISRTSIANAERSKKPALVGD